MISEERIKEVEFKLNTRPRKRFGYENPIFVMNQLLFNTILTIRQVIYPVCFYTLFVKIIYRNQLC